MLKPQRTIAAAVLAAAATVTTTITLTSPADAKANGSSCVTGSEYRHAHKGDRKGHTHRMFDTRGKRFTYFPAGSGYGPTQERRYKACDSGALDVHVWYEKRDHVWRVTAKSHD